jgi:hypothetical protein
LAVDEDRAVNPSFWVATTPETHYPRLEEDVTVDVAESAFPPPMSGGRFFKPGCATPPASHSREKQKAREPRARKRVFSAGIDGDSLAVDFSPDAPSYLARRS